MRKERKTVVEVKCKPLLFIVHSVNWVTGQTCKYLPSLVVFHCCFTFMLLHANFCSSVLLSVPFLAVTADCDVLGVLCRILTCIHCC